MKFDSKIVTFERSPAYVHQRAMLNRRGNNLVDALGLLRRAVEQSPENREYKLDLAEIYCEMGCHEQSNRLLLDLLAEEDAPAECFYGLALNKLGVNDEDGARQALRQYLLREPHGEHSEEVRQLRDELEFFEELRLPRNRRRLRAQHIAERACESMRGENFEHAAGLFERSLRLAPDQKEIRALSALNLLLMGDHAAALARCAETIANGEVSVRTRCMAAQIYQMAGLTAACAEQMQAALREDPDDTELRMLIYTASELNMHREVAELTRRALFETPHDRLLLHARAVALYRSGAGTKRAAALWTRILRIDPEDTIAAYYQDLASRDALEGVELNYAYQVPPAEYERRLRLIAEKLGGGAEEITREWEENASFRLLLKWCTGVGNDNFQRAAVTVLAALEDEEAVSTLREYLSRENVPAELKLQASAVLNMRGADMHVFLPDSDDIAGTLVPDSEYLLNQYSVGTRQMLRFAAEVLEQAYNRRALPTLTLIWTRYICGRRVKACVHSAPEAGAAALAACYLGASGEDIDFGRLCREFGCTGRQLKYIYRRMRDALEPRTGEDHETD